MQMHYTSASKMALSGPQQYGPDAHCMTLSKRPSRAIESDQVRRMAVTLSWLKRRNLGNGPVVFEAQQLDAFLAPPLHGHDRKFDLSHMDSGFSLQQTAV